MFSMYKYRVVDTKNGVSLHLKAKTKDAAIKALENMIKEIKKKGNI